MRIRTLVITRSTVIGAIKTHAIALAENSILLGHVLACRRQEGCMRFCYVPPGSRTPKRYHCQPDLVDKAVADLFAKGAITPEDRDVMRESERLRVEPDFNSTRYGKPTYCQLTDTCAVEISAGADDESEMGAFHDLYQPQRVAEPARALGRVHSSRNRCRRYPGQLGRPLVKADLTVGVTFDPLKQFTGVLMQQGRVQLDSDWNAQNALALYHLRGLAADLFGPAGGPAANLGFAVVPLAANLPAHPVNFAIGAGRYYVHGILCSLEPAWIAVTLFKESAVQLTPPHAWTVDGKLLMKDQYVVLSDAEPGSSIPPAMAKITDIDYGQHAISLDNAADFIAKKPKQPQLRRMTTYLSQPGLPKPPNVAKGLVYLDVWEQLVTYVEDDSIREVALNGPDTAARTRLVWQVRILEGETECQAPQALADRLQPASRGRLRAMAKPKPGPTDPCTIAPDARYRGMENQLYRVEIHTGNLSGNEKPTFKWSRENGAVLYSILGGCGTDRLTLESLGRDDRFGLAIGDWVEIEDDHSVLSNVMTPLLQVRTIDRSRMASRCRARRPPVSAIDAATHPRLRRWDQSFPEGEALLKKGTDNAVRIPDAAGEWLELEDGVRIQFVDTANAKYRPGDFWYFAARVATGDIEWPRETIPDNPPRVEPIARLPDGVVHHYASLAVIGIADPRCPWWAAAVAASS